MFKLKKEPHDTTTIHHINEIKDPLGKICMKLRTVLDSFTFRQPASYHLVGKKNNAGISFSNLVLVSYCLCHQNFHP